jgi:hypothetical protein
MRHAQALNRWAELPDILAADRARREDERAEEQRERSHHLHLAEMRRTTERAMAECEIENARQSLRAQQEFGYISHQLTWQRKQAELAGVELDEAERRALLREARNPQVAASPRRLSVEELIEQLYARREEMRADGLDTSAIDQALEEATDG